MKWPATPAGIRRGMAMKTLTPSRHAITRMHQLNVLHRALRIVAIALGVLAALWLLGGDRDPDARPLTAAPDYVSAVTIYHHEAFSFGKDDIQFFEIAFGATGQRMTVSVDADLAIAKWLTDHAGKQRVQLVLRDVSTLTRDAER